MKEEGLSIVIPVLHELENLKRLLPHLQGNTVGKPSEIIVSCAVDCKATQAFCEENQAIFHRSNQASRAIQMNEGARIARFSVLYFVHADTLPPHTYFEDIFSAIEQNNLSGCYRFKFDKDVFPLMTNSFFTRFKPQMFRGGDQSLFVTTEVFQCIGGFNERYDLMEEYPLIKKLKRSTTFVVMPRNIVVSSRKYHGNSYVKVNLVNLLMFVMFHLGVSTAKLRSTYHSLLNTPKG